MTEATQTNITALKQPGPREANLPDLKIDMFSLRGFELAQRIARAYATADAVPACFRSHILKKDKAGDQWIDNPSAFGNCLVAIETAQAVNMSITAVMQNSNIIEGKLSWAGQFKIGAVNASRRFTHLRYDVKNKGMIKASYKEKDGWNKEKNKYNMIEHTIEIENLECIAWALPFGTAFPPGVSTLDQAKAAGLPVIEGPPVSMKMAVEEGWYAKPGSKWQTEMKHKMLTIRAGAYFSDIHAPDVVMGMGRTTEEILDVIDVHPQADGSVAANLEDLRTNQQPVSKPVDPNVTDVEAKESDQPAASQPAAKAEPTAEAKSEAPATTPADKAPDQEADTLTYAQVADGLEKAKDLDVLDVAADLIQCVPDQQQRTELTGIYQRRKEELAKPKRPPRQTSMNVD